MKIHFILFVKNQSQSVHFYTQLLDLKPSLDVPGMTEFSIDSNITLGIMPEKGIKKVLGNNISDPELSNGISRCEIYFKVDNPDIYQQKAISHGAELISPFQERSWGDSACYLKDPDGHVIAFSKKN